MKATKPLLMIAFAALLMSSCSVLKKKEKYGCPNDARGMSQDDIVEKSNKKKYKGGGKF